MQTFDIEIRVPKQDDAFGSDWAMRGALAQAWPLGEGRSGSGWAYHGYRMALGETSHVFGYQLIRREPLDEPATQAVLDELWQLAQQHFPHAALVAQAATTTAD